MKAAKTGNLATCSRLLGAGTHSIGWQDSYGFTALHHTASNGHLEITRLLLEFGADLAAEVGHYYDTMLSYCIRLSLWSKAFSSCTGR